MSDSIILMPGSMEIDFHLVQRVAGQFGWATEKCNSLREAAAMRAERRMVGLLFSRDAVGSGCTWPDTVWLLRNAFPEARLVACHGFSEPIDWPELCDAGAFHALRVPLQDDEVRQSFGFISEAEKSRRKTAPIAPISVWPRGLRALSEACRADEERLELPRRAAVS